MQALTNFFWYHWGLTAAERSGVGEEERGSSWHEQTKSSDKTYIMGLMIVEVRLCKLSGTKAQYQQLDIFLKYWRNFVFPGDYRIQHFFHVC
jgi:hypothetical protein